MGTKAIYVGSAFTLERNRSAETCDTIIKYPTSEVAAPRVKARLNREYEIGVHLRLPGVRRVIRRLKWHGRPAIELAYIPGESFRTFFHTDQQRPLDISLKLALSAAQALASLHEAGIIHRDIAAGNLLVRKGSTEAILIDLGFASHGGNEDFIFKLEGQLPYLSPEQTGRVELPIDERSDLYALGIVLYEALTGHLPFQANDTAGWIHAHLARLPEAPIAKRPEMPQVLSDIIMRLLAKVPENRYQSAHGLCHDLEHCLRSLNTGGQIAHFTLGKGDHRGRLGFPSDLYGREAEQQQLLTALQQTLDGQRGLQVISGQAGSGKTSLVETLRFPVAATGGRYLYGKFDQTLRGLPYLAFAEAFSQFCHQLLTDSPKELDAFRNRILETLGANAGLLIKLVPVLEMIIGLQPVPPPLDTAESANRFAVTLVSFFHCMVTEAHPLVLFLDDLQWADSASRELLNMIATRALSNHFLLICAYRDGPSDANKSLSPWIDSLVAEWPKANQLRLKGLDLDQATTLVANTLDIDISRSARLSQLIHTKTGGNPFFIRQVLETLATEGTLNFDPGTEQWIWDIEQVQRLDISDSIIELMLRKIARLPENVRQILQIAACIGNSFPLELLAKAAPLSEQNIERLISPATEAGLITMLNDSARFVHDRIQQAIYETLTQNQASLIHLKLGRLLLANRKINEVPMGAVQQLNLGARLIDAIQEKKQLIQLNLEAGNAARATMAYAEARDFYMMGMDLLDDILMDTDSTLAFDFHFHLAETTYYLGDSTTAIHRLNQLLIESQNARTRSRIFQFLVGIHTAEIRMDEALEIGTKGLATLGVYLPKDHSREALYPLMNEIAHILAEHQPQNILSWPPMEDESDLAISGLLTHLIPATYISGSPLFPFAAVEFARRSLQGKLSKFTPFAFSTYGMLLAAMGQHDTSLLLSQLATDIAQRPQYSALKGRADFFHAAFILHWSQPLESTLPFFDRGCTASLEVGDHQFAIYSINHLHGNGLLAGQSLIELEQSFAQFDDTERVIRQEDGHQFYCMLKTSVLGLRHPSKSLPDLTDDIGGMKAIDDWRASNNATMSSFFLVLRALLATILEKSDQALTASEEAIPQLSGLAGMIWIAQHHFFHALALAEAIRNGDRTPEESMAQMEAYLTQFREWAERCPSNYLAKQRLIEAELTDLRGKGKGTLLDAYDEAISTAIQNGRPMEQALACERAAASWQRRGKPQLADLYLQQAFLAYEDWGAEAKLAQLQRDHAASLLSLRPLDSKTISSSSSEGLHAVDFYSVLKAAQTVAGELVIDRMLARLIHLVIETAGAQSGHLLLQRDDEWCVVAEQQGDRSTVDVLQWKPLHRYSDIASSLVHYVARTKKTVSLDDAQKSTLFGTDSSIVERQCRSLLCLPIVNRGELGGILYLENNLTTHAFTRTHTRILQLLMAQAISSLEISRYYARVQDLNRDLEQEIDERKRTESKLEFLANHDTLTDLPNRRLFYDRVTHAIRRVQRNGNRVAVLFLDLDRFKNINDTLSHQVGDQLLKQVAKRLVTLVREEDSVGRLGGDEFVLLIEGDFDLVHLTWLAEKLLASFRDPIQINSYELFPTASLGISVYPDDAADADALLRNADAAMYQAKHSGRNTYRFFSADLAQAALDRINLENDLRRAIDREEFELYFQPQVALESGAIIGAEALIRWHHPERALLTPLHFIALAEERGAIVAIGEWVLRTACHQLRLWRDQGIQIGRLGLNVSSKQIDPQGHFTQLVKEILDTTGITPATLELELTESVILQETSSNQNSLQRLTELGIQLAIDDFGTGYSSLSYLHRLPAQRLKIDQSFVARLPEEGESQAIIRSILMLGKSLGKSVIAEGIETEQQRQFLIQMGCTEGQGYLFGKPMPLKEFALLLQKQKR